MKQNLLPGIVYDALISLFDCLLAVCLPILHSTYLIAEISMMKVMGLILSLR
jgi:hypothetical protein